MDEIKDDNVAKLPFCESYLKNRSVRLFDEMLEMEMDEFQALFNQFHTFIDSCDSEIEESLYFNQLWRSLSEARYWLDKYMDGFEKSDDAD
jgi:hypothetical protein